MRGTGSGVLGLASAIFLMGEVIMSQNETGHKFTNRLINETSPYLLQHAHNPVDWFPWGEEAFALAKKENKPIFLSIGYSSCHWCHVMERESFENEKTAAILNRYFVSIKVDREERPDVDEIYMGAVQLLTGRGGWPLNVFLTPDLKPFYGGTYFPPEPQYGMPGFPMLLERLGKAWAEEREAVINSSQKITEEMNREIHARDAMLGGVLDDSLIESACRQLGGAFDAEWGGFGDAPKFPPSAAIGLLLRVYARTGDEKLLKMATVTLDRMAYGGMYDQLGGGFSRYSTDAQWLVPHFEKMLYDNALLARVYTEAWQATGKSLYRRIARQILDYILKEMTDEAGGFHSAEDADSEGVEGKYYVWSEKEIIDVLGRKDGQFFNDFYGVSGRGNFEGGNILNIKDSHEVFASEHGMNERQLWLRIDILRDKLFKVRDKRIHPGRDDKVLSVWNGMMISSMAYAGQVFREKRYVQGALRAGEFLVATMITDDGGLLRTYRKGQAKLSAYLDDYVEVSNGLIELYQATFDPRWIQTAKSLMSRALVDFWDSKLEVFYFTSAAHKNLLARTKPSFDGATPSGNSIAAMVLLRLGRLMYDKELLNKGQAVLRSSAKMMERAPRAYLNMMWALDFYLYPPYEFAIVGSLESQEVRGFLGAIHDGYIPNKVIALNSEPGSDSIGTQIALLKDKPLIDGKPAVYLCRNFVCLAPVTSVEALQEQMEKK